MKGNLVSRLKNAFEKKKVDLVLYDLKAFFFLIAITKIISNLTAEQN
jgi:hypothetical protein